MESNFTSKDIQGIPDDLIKMQLQKGIENLKKSENKISARIIADSINPAGVRLTSFVLTFPRIVLAEFNTHRALSRNSASSRAIPFCKPENKTDMLRIVESNPFIPIRWMKEHEGMQGYEYFDEVKDNELIQRMKTEWLSARDYNIARAKNLHDFGLTKQIINRLLEPWLWHTVIATGSEWENFFSLRAEKNAEIHIQDLAYKMLNVYNESTPKSLKPMEWHIPFGDTFNDSSLKAIHNTEVDVESPNYWTAYELLKVKIATARCARVSYLNFDGSDNYSADVKLHDRLAKAGHMSPFEHCAISMNSEDWFGNFKGFRQYRKRFPNENRKDDRVFIKKYEI